MKLIIPATNREGSYSLKVAQTVQDIYQNLGDHCEILDMRSLDFKTLLSNPYPNELPLELKSACDKIVESEALIIVCPEYNGSFPGIFKHFLDHWHYPESFSFKPVCLIGLGGRFGALRPLEHLAAIFSYRNSFLFPEKIFISNVQETFKNGSLKDTNILERIKKQAENFIKFVRALNKETFN